MTWMVRRGAMVRFGYADRDYEIELSEAHAAELEEVFAPYLGLPVHGWR